MQEDDASAPRVRLVEITAADQGQRIDNFLMRHANGVPRSAVYRVIRTGQVRINGGRVKPARKLAAGDQVRIPPLRVTPRSEVRVPDAVVQRLLAGIVLDTEDFIAIDKPAGLAVHGGSGLAFGAIDALRQGLSEPRLELVHRLDRGTSGCLLVARNPAVNRELQGLWRERRVTKRYRALVAGHWPAHVTRVDAPLLANQAHAGERRVVVSADGQSAVSHFDCLSRHDGLSDMAVRIDTGRTHQIRVHARHIGHAVIGDTRYGDNAANARWKQRGLGRMFLHAARLEFEWRGQIVSITAPVDAAWVQAVSEVTGPAGNGLDSSLD